ncbi:MAG: polysaccharide deacetylase family protein [Patescibacteria group bacterium]
MRRFLVLLAVFLAFAGVVTVSAKTMQERRAERLARRLSQSSSLHQAASSINSSNAPIPKSEVLSPKSFPTTPIIERKDIHFSIPLLVYHHLRPAQPYPKTTWSWKMSVSPAVFGQQMQWLEDHGYTPVDLDTYVKIARGETLGPVKPVAITFDDSHRTQYDVAFPILKERGFTAVFYLITKTLDAGESLTRAQVKEMGDAGMDIQSHTVNHLQLTRLGQAELDWELAESRRVLEELTGKPVRHIAYPATMQNALVRERAAEAGYVTGTLMDPRRATEKDEFLRIPRIMMTDETELGRVLP